MNCRDSGMEGSLRGPSSTEKPFLHKVIFLFGPAGSLPVGESSASLEVEPSIALCIIRSKMSLLPRLDPAAASLGRTFSPKNIDTNKDIIIHGITTA